jgi:hypothetical protein
VKRPFVGSPKVLQWKVGTLHAKCVEPDIVNPLSLNPWT